MHAVYHSIRSASISLREGSGANSPRALLFSGGCDIFGHLSIFYMSGYASAQYQNIIALVGDEQYDDAVDAIREVLQSHKQYISLSISIPEF